MKLRQVFLTLIFTALIILPPGLPQPLAAETVIKIGGSGFALELMKILATAYQKSHSGVRIVIVPSLGSSGGIKALLSAALDFSISSRPLKNEEKAKGADGFELARTPFVFIVNGKVKKQSLTTMELEKIYNRQTTTWSDGTPIRLVLRPATETDTVIVRSISPAMAAAVESAQARRGMIVAFTDQDAAEAVEKISGALGGITLTQILTEKRQVNILALNGVSPGVRSGSESSYPLVKSIYLVTSPQTSPAARQFIEFIGSGAGRKILAKYASPVAAPR